MTKPMSDEFIRDELLRYYAKDFPAAYKRDTLAIWRTNAKLSGDYQKGYAMAVARIEGAN